MGFTTLHLQIILFLVILLSLLRFVNVKSTKMRTRVANTSLVIIKTLGGERL